MEQEELLDYSYEDNNKPKNKKRPVIITIVCLLGFAGGLFTIPLIFSDIAAQVGSWYPPYLGFASFIGLFCMIGLWKMKKWSAYLYTGFTGLNQIMFAILGSWNIMTLIIPGVVAIIALYHIHKMD